MHGWGQNLTCFKYLTSYFSQFFRVNLIDFEGFGKSGKLTTAKTVKDYANDVLLFIKDNNLNNIILLGHSFGGRVAIELCANYPEYFDKLILVDSAGLLPKRNIKYYYKIYLYKIKKKLKLNTNNMGSNDYIKLDNIMKETFCNVVNYNQKPLLKNISTKTLIIFGENDKSTPIFMAKIFNKNISNSKLTIMKNCGHFPFIEDTFNFIKIVEDFIYE